MSSAGRLFPWVWAGLVGTAAVLLLLNSDVGPGFVDVLTTSVAVLAIVLIAAFGSVISSLQPGNRIAWLFHLISIGLLIVIPSSLTMEAIDPASTDFPDVWDYMAVVIIDGLSGSILFAVFLLLFLFPTGRFLTSRYAWAGWICGVFVPAYFLTVLFSEELAERYTEDPFWQISNPIGFLPAEVYELMSSIWIVLVMVIAIGGVVAIVDRYRRSNVVVRTQIKWVLYAAAVAAISLPVGWGDFALADVFMMSAFFLIPVAVTIAITRFKLFEIDRIISRTVAYAVVVAVLGATYFGLVTLITSLLPSQNTLAVAGSTLVVAALFNPLRRRVRHAVDRRFNRSAFQAETIIKEFAARLRESRNTEEIVEAWHQTVFDAFQPESSGTWLNDTYTTPTPNSRRT